MPRSMERFGAREFPCVILNERYLGALLGLLFEEEADIIEMTKFVYKSGRDDEDLQPNCTGSHTDAIVVPRSYLKSIRRHL